MDDKSRVASRRERVFPSKRDRWAVAMMWCIAIFTWGVTLWVLRSTHDPAEKLLTVALGAVTGSSGLYFLVTTRYRITDTHLHMHSGPIHMKLRLDRISSVRPVGGVESTFQGYAMGMSLDVLLIEREDGRFGYRVSPLDQAGFLDCLAERCPRLRRTQDGLQR